MATAVEFFGTVQAKYVSIRTPVENLGATVLTNASRHGGTGKDRDEVTGRTFLLSATFDLQFGVRQSLCNFL